VKKALEEKGLVRGAKPHDLVLPRSERNGSIVEPMISTQWFVKMQPLAEPALAAVREGKTSDPARRVGEDVRALDDQHPRLVHLAAALVGPPHPRVIASVCGHITVTLEEQPGMPAPSAGRRSQSRTRTCSTPGSPALLWPFSTLGWPEQTDALKRFYPASDLETGYDILFFWVARMMMMGIHFMGEPPFRACSCTASSSTRPATR
jgi:valyl-tRNA synthetase